ncbi:hypothetical protein [Corallococcus sp. CA049B]|uniref:hypothetical protein n=1 Tax=Corallococcus sp. CA049B TaxID=2316730 RepID=UPI0011C4121E|nr:hypothetical protein [Corallococcus sp. CA049B]
MKIYALAAIVSFLIGTGALADESPDAGPPSAIAALAAAADTPTANAADAGVFAQTLQTFAGYENLNATAARQPIDTVVVSRLVRQRLGRVQAEVLRDAFRGVIPSENPAVGDVLDAVAALIVELADSETQAQNLLSSLSRSSAAIALSVLVPDAQGCACAGDQEGKLCNARIEAAYEGLSQSARLKVLGFPFADGKFSGDSNLQDKCKAYSNGIAVMIDTALVGLPLSRLKEHPAKLLFQDVLNHANALATDCSNVAGFAEASDEVDLSSLSTVDLAGLSRYADALVGVAPAPGSACQKSLRAFRATLTASGLLAANKHFGETASPKLDALVATIERSRVLLKNAIVGYPMEAALLPLRRLVDGGQLRRGEVLEILGGVKRALESAPKYSSSTTVKPVVDALFDELPHVIREDTNTRIGVRLDVTSLGSRMVARYIDTRRDGLYLRATVGVGYLALPGLKGASDLRPLVYEEVGVGYRWSTGGGRLLIGPHLAASGILNQFVLEESTGKGVLGLAGVSVNIYKLVDVSLNASYLFASDQLNNQFGVVVGLQIPLMDYIGALGSSGSVEGE